MKKLVECKNITKSFGRKKAIDNLDLVIPKGKIIGLLGPNGSGKTTFIKLLNGLLSLDSGSILIDGNQPGIETKKKISYLSERTYLDPNMKVSEAIEYFHDFYEDFDVEKAYELLKRLDINPKVKLKTQSKGTREKIQLILVMSRKAELYILDEPIGGVDPASRDYILDTILTNFQDGASILISTHLISDIERILDEVIFIKNGKVVLQESTENLRGKKGKSIDECFREEFKC